MACNLGWRRRWVAWALGIVAALAVAPLSAQQLCGGVDYPFPYTDVAGVGAAFCPGIMEAYVTGVSKGTSPSTFSPNNTVTRVQMSTFLQRSLDQGLKRSSRRAALGQWWTPQGEGFMQPISVGASPVACVGDGADIWVASLDAGHVVQVEAHTGRVLGTWTATAAAALAVAGGKVFVVSQTSPGKLYALDPTQPPGVLSSVATVGDLPASMAFDGINLWTTNFSGSLSAVNAQTYAVSNYGGAPLVQPLGIVFDGAHLWVSDYGAGKLFELDPQTVSILNTVPVGTNPQHPVFDGANIWVPNRADSSLTVVQASTAAVVATITADVSNGLDQPVAVAFDGERILVSNANGASLTLFKAADLSLIGHVTTSTEPDAACADGVNFWVTLPSAGLLLRF